MQIRVNTKRKSMMGKAHGKQQHKNGLHSKRASGEKTGTRKGEKRKRIKLEKHHINIHTIQQVIDHGYSEIYVADAASAKRVNNLLNGLGETATVQIRGRARVDRSNTPSHKITKIQTGYRRGSTRRTADGCSKKDDGTGVRGICIKRRKIGR